MGAIDPLTTTDVEERDDTIQMSDREAIDTGGSTAVTLPKSAIENGLASDSYECFYHPATNTVLYRPAGEDGEGEHGRR